ncbi:MAG TPA: anthrone oxygenase family protein [Acidobacteriaceae bacterium]|jgi:uncharacterized membrane protein|nr:anthrone oxygenase family protein [Acidobacteriaceae bacterium]
MLILDVITILCIGLMTGNELAVSLFVNPAIWQLEDRAQAAILRILARSLGKAMPVWYIASLILMGIEAFLHRQQSSLPWLLAAIALWIAIILYTVTSLVPINNRVAALDPAHLPDGWSAEHRTWDARHRFRILVLVLASASLTCGLLIAR